MRRQGATTPTPARKRGFRHGAALLFALVAVLGSLDQPARAAQPPLPISMPTAAPAVSERKYQIKRVGSLEVAPIYFEGLRLFDVSAPANRDPNAFPPVASRVEIIEDNLRDVIPPATAVIDFFRPAPTRYDPATFEVRIGKHNGYVTLTAADGSGAKETPLITLTDQDARYNGVTVNELARAWADTLQSVLVDALRQRQPGALAHQASSAALIFVLALLLTALLFALRLAIKRQRSSLEAQRDLADEGAEGELAEAAGQPSIFVIRTLAFADWILRWSILIAWSLSALLILYAFPQTQGLARRLGSQVVAVFVIWFVAVLINRVGAFLVVRVARSWEERPFLTLDEAGRRHLRFPTIVRSVDYAKTLAVFFAAFALTLGVVGASASSVVTFGAALAFAVSFGAQSLVKDLVNGFFILIEDQYATGDYVTIGTAAGFIESVTLRITQLRSDDGRLITIPNSQVAVVENWTRSWSRVDYRVSIAFDSDVQHALRVFEAVLDELARDPHWSRLIIEPPRVLGVDQISSLGVVLRGWVQTAPGKMFVVSRELNRRMHEALDREGIAIGMPVSRVFRNEPASAM